MAEQKSVICPKCGKTITADADASELFCTYCGERFETSTEDVGERVREAYGNKDYALVLEQAGEEVCERDRALGMLRTSSEYYVIRKNYFTEAAELASHRKAKSIIGRFLSGKDEYADNPIHERWYKDAERVCASLARQIKESVGGANEALGRSLAHELARSLLTRKNEKKEGTLYWPSVAVEHFSIPLLAYIDTERLSLLYDDYRSYYKRYERLPNQEKVLAAMKSELESR